MLNLMRKHARNWLMKVILGIIIIVFVFYFGSMGGRQRAERIAVIDGKPIVYADFQREYQNLADRYRRQFGQGLTEEMLKSLNLKQQALDNLITQAVILRKAEDMNVKVTDEDVKAMILAYPGFQRNGSFDQQFYEQTLRANRMTPEEFEATQRKLLIALNVEDLIQTGIKVSDQEVYELYRMQNEKINVDFILISPETFAAEIKTAPADLEAFLNTHAEQFRVPEQVQVKFLAFTGQDYASAAGVSDEEAAAYYERHKEQWTKNNKVQPLAEVRGRIAAELSLRNGMYAAADQAKQAHDTIYQEENFDAYAAQKNLPVRTTGLFRIGNPPSEFGNAAEFIKIISSLQKNEISRVIQGEKGYYIIMITDRKASYLPALKEIEPEVERQYRQAEAKLLAQKEAEALLARLKKGESIEAVAGEKNLKILETGLFPPGGAVPKLGASTDLTEALFQISEKKPYPEQPYLIEGNYALIRFKERGKVIDTDFTAQKDALEKYMARQKKTALVKAWIEGTKNTMVREGRLKFTRNFEDL